MPGTVWGWVSQWTLEFRARSGSLNVPLWARPQPISTIPGPPRSLLGSPPLARPPGVLTGDPFRGHSLRGRVAAGGRVSSGADQADAPGPSQRACPRSPGEPHP